MSKFPGGVFSKASGQMSGIVFAQARTRKGKVLTSRGLVPPGNPQSPNQQANRGIFDFCQYAVRQQNTGVYRQDWDNGVGELAGYQSLISLIRRSFVRISYAVDEFLYEAQNQNEPTELGELHTPETVSVVETSSTQFTFNWSNENGTNGQASDEARALVFSGYVNQTSADWFSVNNFSAVRSDGTVNVNHPAVAGSGFAFGVLYFRNLNNPEGGQLSSAIWRLP